MVKAWANWLAGCISWQELVTFPPAEYYTTEFSRAKRALFYVCSDLSSYKRFATRSNRNLLMRLGWKKVPGYHFHVSSPFVLRNQRRMNTIFLGEKNANNKDVLKSKPSSEFRFLIIVFITRPWQTLSTWG